MVERGGLENRCGRKVTVGSNPTLSANNYLKFNCRVQDQWRDDRVAEGARLEIVCSVTRYRGFESLSLRQ